MNIRKTLSVFSVFVVILSAIAFSSCKTAASQKAEIQPPEWNTNYKYVFVHGLAGWGHYDSQNSLFPYWGLVNGSLLKKLNKQGFDCYDASVAPYGSAWDRACELYAQLAGTVTDYGAAHSAKCGHARFGHDFSKEPLINQWDEEHKINLIGHSFGGATVRLFAHLLENGSEEERNATTDGSLSPLFEGGHGGLIYSLTTLAAPHNGSSIYHIPADTEAKNNMQKLMSKATNPQKDGRADFDYADFDMHIQNADELNRKIKTISTAYYFSVPCSATQAAEDGTQEPVPGLMEKLYQSSSVRMGTFEGRTPDGVLLGKEWQENDGLVNTLSARAPSHAPSADFPAEKADARKLQKGLWYIMPVYKGDHMSLQGGLTIENEIASFYIDHLNMINSLEE